MDWFISMDNWCYIVLGGAGGAGIVFVLFVSFEIHYFLRILLCIINVRFVKRSAGIMDTLQVTGICLTNDIDVHIKHMNNARYLREVDFAKVDFFERTKLYRTVVSKGGSIVQNATTIRYRRFIRPFSFFKITSTIVYWDDQSIYMEHRFVSPVDGFIHCVVISRQRIIGVSAEEVMNCLLLMNESDIIKNELDNTESALLGRRKPDIPIEIFKWIEYNAISSNRLRKDQGQDDNNGDCD